MPVFLHGATIAASRRKIHGGFSTTDENAEAMSRRDPGESGSRRAVGQGGGECLARSLRERRIAVGLTRKMEPFQKSVQYIIAIAWIEITDRRRNGHAPAETADGCEFLQAHRELMAIQALRRADIDNNIMVNTVTKSGAEGGVMRIPAIIIVATIAASGCTATGQSAQRLATYDELGAVGRRVDAIERRQSEQEARASAQDQRISAVEARASSVESALGQVGRDIGKLKESASKFDTSTFGKGCYLELRAGSSGGDPARRYRCKPQS